MLSGLQGRGGEQLVERTWTVKPRNFSPGSVSKLSGKQNGSFPEKGSDAQQQKGALGGAHWTGLPPTGGFPGSQVLAPRDRRDTNAELCDASLMIRIGLWQSAFFRP